jgi:hypothetical protein
MSCTVSHPPTHALHTGIPGNSCYMILALNLAFDRPLGTGTQSMHGHVHQDLRDWQGAHAWFAKVLLSLSPTEEALEKYQA